ncbi:Rhodanese-like domain-containing protein [Echria macrotheca]|uniref:Rhodanese-like domain-containing protein n=1 Tax=Echria macrotheca TaxID=438768 RepID=A0AAJ0BG33_9PEZI|nr:Rhodanese-like domain-containing protein [Echria macrotheca]
MAESQPWYAAYPPPRSEPVALKREDVLALMRNKVAGRDYVLVDLRRVDHEGGTICGSINLPAQSLYLSLGTLYTMFKAAEVTTVIWYCGSSRGRGSRAAAWFADYISDHAGGADTEMQSVILEGGIKGWAAAGKEFTALMDGYDEDVWKAAS